jgi:hypothetical protein
MVLGELFLIEIILPDLTLVTTLSAPAELRTKTQPAAKKQLNEKGFFPL